MRTEKLWLKIVNLLPRKLCYWVMIRVGAEVTTGKYGNTLVTELTYMDALKRWEDGSR